ncbi:hypothetical protein [Chenggangzhangella methanolivorans]|uniref:Uncharacterized protein n=1 Tax=Chenggangzhangella methanolivorans TaxID=1437009 RepID=A0A9E6UHH1_9HYPH|nr:hypothetical protein [Chenggangzhangella methanolivorans]QZN99777.1 hypothetical protein K6K41_24460 [Chenggangzhangella methanolivorans]
MTTIRRRKISSAVRAILSIEPMRRRFRTLHPPRRYSVKGLRPPFQLDGYVTVSVARVRWAERGFS